MDIALAYLLAVIEGVGMEEGPHQEPADPFYSEGKVGMLKHSVMTGAIKITGKGFKLLAPFFDLASEDLLGEDDPAGAIAGSGTCHNLLKGKEVTADQFHPGWRAHPRIWFSKQS
jgi:hypothetical protein